MKDYARNILARLTMVLLVMVFVAFVWMSFTMPEDLNSYEPKTKVIPQPPVKMNPDNHLPPAHVGLPSPSSSVPTTQAQG